MINEELKVRFLAGECTEEELIALRDILKNSPEEKQELFKEEKLSDELKAQFMPKTQLMLAEQRMQAKIREMKAEQQAEHHAHINRYVASGCCDCCGLRIGWIGLVLSPAQSDF